MAIQWLQYNSFEYIAELYASIKPLVSKLHTREQDIRPIGDRNRKHERIAKINDNCYILQDGYHSGDDAFPCYYYRNDDVTLKPTEAEIIKLAPIVWRKHRDGSQTITIRNGTGGGAHMSRYSFLDRHLPQGLEFLITNGKQFVVNDANRYYLAKSNTVAEYALRPEGKRGVMTSRDDGVSLTFKRITKYPRCFEFVSGGKAIPKPPKQIVDKKAKAKMKDDIIAFRDWASITFPMLPKDDRDYRSRLVTELVEYSKGQGVGARGGFSQYGWNVVDSFAGQFELSRNIISDDDHPLRLHLAYFLFSSIEDIYDEDMDTAKNRAYVMTTFNRRINKVCNFTKTVKG